MTETQTNPNRPRRDSNEWRESREAALQRDDGECRNCSRENDLQVHHVLPASKGGSHDLENLLTLCNDCHWHLHRNESRWEGDRLTLDHLSEYEPSDYRGWRVPRGLSETEEEILAALRDSGELQRKEITDRVSSSGNYVGKKLNRLKISGYVERVRRGVYRYRSVEESKQAWDETHDTEAHYPRENTEDD